MFTAHAFAYVVKGRAAGHVRDKFGGSYVIIQGTGLENAAIDQHNLCRECRQGVAGVSG